MTEFEQYAKMLLARLDVALRVVEGNDESDKKMVNYAFLTSFLADMRLGMCMR
uniref:Uncharacterized protein n=1 Tax=uncultured prokaryote TaxID=198431 RepID=A0A0H5QHR6_9ZZZZ|nr:hypothetical protein [uncultured prokaryote]